MEKVCTLNYGNSPVIDLIANVFQRKNFLPGLYPQRND